VENKHWNLFVARFFECPFCFEDNNKREDELAACHDAYMEHYEFAFCRFHRCCAPSLAAARPQNSIRLNAACANEPDAPSLCMAEAG
jgi:hypothetical protein